MASGSFECSPSGALQCRVEWNSVASGSIDNYSTVTVRVYARRTDSYTTTGTFKGWACIENSSSQSVGEHYGGVSSGWVLIHTHSGRVNHNSDGSKSVTIYGSVTGPSGTSLAGKTSTGSQTVTLDKIDRFATMTGASNFNDEQNPWFTFNNPANAPMNCWLEINPAGEHLAIRELSGKSGTYTWELTDEERQQLRNKIPNSNTAICRIGLNSKIGNVSQSSYLDRTFTIINANPTFSNFDFNDVNPTTLALTGNSKYNINGYSTIKAIISTSNKAVAKKGATMTNYRFTCGDKRSQDDMIYSESQSVSGTINGTPNGVYNVYATDSRNNSTLVTKLATKVIEYTPIYIDRQNTYVKRDNSDVGDNVILTYSGTIWNNSFGAKSNSIKSASYRFKKTTSNDWLPGETNITPTISGNKFSFEALVRSNNPGYTFDLDKSYDFEITIADQLSTDTFRLTPVSRAKPNIAFADNGVGIMGAYDEKIGGPAQVNGNPLAYYPIGSIYLSTNNTNPSELFGGTWEAWGSGRVPVGVNANDSDFNTAEKTGGNKNSEQLYCGTSNYSLVDSAGPYSDRTIVRSPALSSSHSEINAQISLLQPYITCYMWKRTA